MISQIFRLMRAEYGTGFTNRFPTDPAARKQAIEEAKIRWAQKLGKYTPTQIEQAVESMSSYHPKWPPSLGEFEVLCRVNSGKGQNRLAITENVQVADKAVGEDCIRQCREFINGS